MDCGSGMPCIAKTNPSCFSGSCYAAHSSRTDYQRRRREPAVFTWFRGSDFLLFSLRLAPLVNSSTWPRSGWCFLLISFFKKKTFAMQMNVSCCIVIMALKQHWLVKATADRLRLIHLKQNLNFLKKSNLQKTVTSDFQFFSHRLWHTAEEIYLIKMHKRTAWMRSFCRGGSVHPKVFTIELRRISWAQNVPLQHNAGIFKLK